MLPYIHSLFDKQQYLDLPKIIEVCGNPGSGKTTALIQLGWEYQQMQFGTGCKKSPEVNYVIYEAKDDRNMAREGLWLMDFYIPNHSNSITISYPSSTDSNLMNKLCDVRAFDVYQSMEGIVLVDEVPNMAVMTAIINNLGPEVQHLAIIPPNGNATYLHDVILTSQPGHCLVWPLGSEEQESPTSGFGRLVEEELLRANDRRQFDGMSLYRREHNATYLAHLYGGIDGAHHKDYLIDQMVRSLTEQRYDRFVKEIEEDGGEWNEGSPP